MKRVLDYPFYPLLVGIYPALYLFANNHTLFSRSDLFIAMLLQLMLTGLALLLSKRFFASWHQAGLFVSLLWTLLFGFWLYNSNQAHDTLSYSVFVLAPFTLIGFFLIKSWYENIPRFAHIFNAGGLVLVIMPAYSTFSETTPVEPVITAWPTQPFPRPATTNPARPNIFHIVLDGYSRRDVLKKVYQYDNSAFETRLRQAGFHIADKATTPYGQTLLALSAIFNSEYLPHLDRRFNARQHRNALGNQLQQNQVIRFLHDSGYRFITTMTPYKGARFYTSDTILPTGYSTETLHLFLTTLYDKTPLGAAYQNLSEKIHPKNSIVTLTQYALTAPYYKNLPQPPFFVFQHILSPHSPFFIDDNGNIDPTRQSIADADHYTKGLAEKKMLYRRGYIAKLKYTNTALIQQVKGIIRHVTGPLIIIIHGDHGGGMHLYHERYDKSCISERFSPFLAVYARGVEIDSRTLDSLNLVNLYRVIFNAGFDTQLPILPDRHYFVPWSNLSRTFLIDTQRMTETCPSL